MTHSIKPKTTAVPDKVNHYRCNDKLNSQFDTMHDSEFTIQNELQTNLLKNIPLSF